MPVTELDPMNMQVLGARRSVGGSYKVDVSRGERIRRVSPEWFDRPDNERFLSPGALADWVSVRAYRSETRALRSARIRVKANRDDSRRLPLMLPDADAPVAAIHWSFGQLISLVGPSIIYLRQLPAHSSSGDADTIDRRAA